MTDTPATTQTASDTLAQAVYQEFKNRPIMVSAALKQFSKALNTRYPALHIDVLTTTVNAPDWVSDEQGTRISRYTTIPLLEVMIQSITAKAQLDFTPTHFLSDAQGQRIAVEMREVEDLLRRLPKVMVAALQHALTEYWNEPAVEGTSRWQWLSDVLRTALLVSIEQAGNGLPLDQEQVDTLLQIVHYPTKTERSSHYGDDCARAFLVDYQARTGRSASANLSYEVLVTRKVNDREVVLCFEPCGAIETHVSLQAFAHAAGIKWGRRMAFTALELQPYESIGDVFVTQAQALLNNQLESLNFFGAFEGRDLKDLEDRYARLTDLAPHLLKPDSGVYQQALYSEVSSQLPDWIELATPAETQQYSRYLFRLGALQLATKGQTYTHGLRTTEQFAKDALLARMPHYGETLDPDTLEITQTRYMADAPGAPTGTAITETDSLTRRAMKGLVGLLHASTKIKSTDATALPAWVTEDNLRTLIADADIGKHYPEEINKVLLEDLEQRPGRETLYANQQRVQLPMLALENKIRKQSGFTDGGYRCVLAVMQSDLEARRVDGLEIAIWPLAFKTEASDRPDVVANMFVIGPRRVASGPHILYRPLYPEKLIEFTSQGALMEEIEGNQPRDVLASLAEQAGNAQHPQPLQKSILDWLEPDARRIYQDGGFRAPNLPRLVIDPDFPAYWNPAPAELDKQPLSGDLLAQLYEANVRLMTRQAEEQLQSVAEYRWAVLYGLGWRVFDSALNALFPFLSGPAATFGWMFVTGSGVLQALKSLEDGDDAPIKDFTFNLLVQLAAVLLTHRLSAGSPVSITPFEPLPTLPRPNTPEVAALIKPAIGPGAASAITDSVLDFSTPISANSRQLLERFISSRQEGVGPLMTLPAPKGIEVVGGRWYAKVPGRISGHGWAGVAPAQGENVVVLDNLGAPIKWLELKNNGQDLWDTAPEFRVRGGGPGMSRYLSDVFADPELRARRADYAVRVKKLEDRLPALDTGINQVMKDAQEAFAKARLVAEDIGRNAVPPEMPAGIERGRLESKLEALKKSLRNVDLDYKKKARIFIDGHLNRIGLLEQVLALLERDNSYQRDAILEKLQMVVVGYGVVDEELIRLSAIWPELGLTHKEVFPLAFKLRTAATDVPYSALLEIRKRLINVFPERIRVSARLEQTIAELEVLDKSTRKGYLQRTGYLSAETQLIKNALEKRVKTTEWLTVHELISLRGALAGDPALEPSLVEEAGLEGLGEALLGEVSTNVLKLNSTQGFDPRQRIELLQEAVNVYNDAELMAGYLRKVDDRQTYVPQAFLGKFLEALKKMRAVAEKELAESVSEDVLAEPVPVESEQPAGEMPKKTRKRIRRPNERLIKTSDGYRVGDVREITASEPDETVAVKNLETGEDLIYYKHEGEDFYQQRTVEQPEAPQLPRIVPGLRALIDKGEKLVDGVTKLIVNYKKDAYLYREPASLEDRFLAQARKLEELAADINQKMQGVTGPDRGTGNKVFQDLRSASEKLIKEGKQLRVNLTKRLPPNAGSFEYLLGEHEVQVGKSSWIDKSTPAKTEFLLEYEVLDNAVRGADKVLWYAHFHCSSKSVGSLLEAHLKLKHLRFMTVKDQLQNPGFGLGKVVYPGTMKTDFSKRYFFDPHPPRV